MNTFRTIRRYSPNSKGTAILLMNLGGPSKISDVHPFLLRLFSDGDLISIPFQKYAARFIALMRRKEIEEQYQKIGGGSPILKWTTIQGELMANILDKKCPESSPHKPFIAFRYADPLTEDTLLKIRDDGFKKVIAFTQYPQYSCSTTGSSLNELYRKIIKLGLTDIEFSVIDRWGTNVGLINAISDRIKNALEKYPIEIRDKVIILFSAHSLPMSVVNKGDSYPSEIAATVAAIMHRMGNLNPYNLVWQSKVGPSEWLGPQTNSAIKGLASQGHMNMLLVPVAFTSDHIETLFELDLQYIEEARLLGATGLRRAESLNDSPIFIDAMVCLVRNHIMNGLKCSKQFILRCPGCTNQTCIDAKLFFSKHITK